jgi:hypothetical protein
MHHAKKSVIVIVEEAGIQSSKPGEHAGNLESCPGRGAESTTI